MNITTQHSITLFGFTSISREKFLSLCMAFCGFSSISAIALTMFQIASLNLLFSYLVVPSVLFISIAGLTYPRLGILSVKGWLAGLVAVFLYDVSRLPFILAGLNDFIPNIGVWLLQQENAHPLIGYLYRYAGNGGGMGLAFALLYTVINPRWKFVVASTTYGLGIFIALMLTLIFSSLGQKEMFEITPLSFSGSLIGHIIYGWVLGLTLKRIGLSN